MLKFLKNGTGNDYCSLRIHSKYAKDLISKNCKSVIPTEI